MTEDDTIRILKRKTFSEIEDEIERVTRIFLNHSDRELGTSLRTLLEETVEKCGCTWDEWSRYCDRCEERLIRG